MTVRPSLVIGADGLAQQIQASDQAVVGDVAVLAPPLTGASITLAAYRTILNDTVTVATLTIALPVSPADRQTHYVTSRTAVAALTMMASSLIGGLPTSLTAGGNMGFQYIAAAGAWVRIQ